MLGVARGIYVGGHIAAIDELGGAITGDVPRIRHCPCLRGTYATERRARLLPTVYARRDSKHPRFVKSPHSVCAEE